MLGKPGVNLRAVLVPKHRASPAKAGVHITHAGHRTRLQASRFDTLTRLLFDHPMAADQAHVPSIDGLRAVAALGVFCAHAVPRWITGGGNGLDAFFVISGFLITGVLLRRYEQHGKVQLGAFYARRALRIWPALLVMLLAMTVVYVTRENWHELKNVGWAATATMNFGRAFGFTNGGALGHTWTLAVEEQFYLLWPLLLAFTPWLKHRRALVIGLLVTLVLLAVAKTLFLVQQERDDFHSDGLIIGCMLALWRPDWLNRVSAILWPVALTGLLLVFIALTSGNTALHFWTNTWSALLAGCVIVAAAEGNRMRVLEFRPLTWLGERSYGFYLWHLPVVVEMYQFDLDPLVRAAVAFVVTVGLAAVSYRFIEQPIRRFGLSRMPQKKPAAEAAGGA